MGKPEKAGFYASFFRLKIVNNGQGGCFPFPHCYKLIIKTHIDNSIEKRKVKKMKAKVLGIQQVNYTSKKTGKPVVGTTLHCSMRDSDVYGVAVDSIFVSENLGLKPVIDNVTLGTLINVEYNNRGYINDVTILPDEKPAVSNDKPANPNEKPAKQA